MRDPEALALAQLGLVENEEDIEHILLTREEERLSSHPRKGAGLAHRPFEVLKAVINPTPEVYQARGKRLVEERQYQKPGQTGHKSSDQPTHESKTSNRKGTIMNENQTQGQQNQTPAAYRNERDQNNRYDRELQHMRRNQERLEGAVNEIGGALKALLERMPNQPAPASHVDPALAALLGELKEISAAARQAATHAQETTTTVKKVEKAYLDRAGDFVLGELTFSETVTEPLVTGFMYGVGGTLGVIAVAAGAKAIGAWVPGT